MGVVGLYLPCLDPGAFPTSALNFSDCDLKCNPEISVLCHNRWIPTLVFPLVLTMFLLLQRNPSSRPIWCLLQNMTQSPYLQGDVSVLSFISHRGMACLAYAVLLSLQNPGLSRVPDSTSLHCTSLEWLLNLPFSFGKRQSRGLMLLQGKWFAFLCGDEIQSVFRYN